MSAIVIKWVNKTGGYEHTALYLNNLENQAPVYISIYQPNDSKRFASQTFEDDLKNHTMVNYVVVPSLEDGNKFGLSEAVMAKYWEELYKIKKNSHASFVAALDSDPDKKNIKSALNSLSEEFKKFTAHNLFNNKRVLDCTKFVAKILQKGGLNLYVQEKSLTGFVGVSEIIGLAKEAVKKISETLDGKPKIKSPRHDTRFLIKKSDPNAAPRAERRMRDF